MHIHPLRAGVWNCFHFPQEPAQETVCDGIKTVTSAPVRPPFPFNKLVLSANFQTATDGCLLLEVQVCVGKTWSDFYKLGLLSGKFKTSFPAQKDAWGQVETDQLVLSAPAQAYRYRLKFYGDAELTLLAASVVRSPFVYDEKSAALLPKTPVLQQVPAISQMQQDTPHKRRICSPCCVYMALNALGYVVPLEQVLPNVFDQNADVYGNWLFNMAAAAHFGAKEYFRRFTALQELAQFITADSLVVASIGFKKDELPQAPLEKTPGHLVLLRGYKDGQVWVADPAAPTKDTVLRAYDAQAFARVWLHHKQGAAYVIGRK